MYSSPVDAESAHVYDTAYGIRSNEETKAPIKVGKKGASVDNVQFAEEHDKEMKTSVRKERTDS